MRHWIDLVEGSTPQPVVKQVAQSLLYDENLIDWARTAAECLIDLKLAVDDEYVETHYYEAKQWILENFDKFQPVFERKLAAGVEKINNIFQNGSATLYRVMAVKPNYADSLTPNMSFGIHWTYDPNIVESFLQLSGPNDPSLTSELVVTAEVDLLAIDWFITLLSIIEMNDFEREIRLKPNQHVSLMGLTLDGVPLDISVVKTSVT